MVSLSWIVIPREDWLKIYGSRETGLPIDRRQGEVAGEEAVVMEDGGEAGGVAEVGSEGFTKMRVEADEEVPWGTGGKVARRETEGDNAHVAA